MQRKNKKAAIELSIGTIVIVVLAMTMLIMGLVLVRTIFTGATDSVDEINEGVKSEIKKLFQDENDKAVIRLSGSEAKVEQGEEFGFVLGVRNNDRTQPKTYEYTVKFKGATPSDCAKLKDDLFENWIAFPSGTMSAGPGEIDEKIIRVIIPEDAPLCTAQYLIEVKDKDTNTIYEDPQFFIKIKSKGVF